MNKRALPFGSGFPPFRAKALHSSGTPAARLQSLAQKKRTPNLRCVLAVRILADNFLNLFAPRIVADESFVALVAY